MKSPKPYLIYNGKTFIESIIQGYFNAGIRDICLVIRKEYTESKWESEFEKIKPMVSVVEKIKTDHGRFYSLKTGLVHFLNFDFCFIHNIDNPFINDSIIKILWENRQKVSYVKAVNHKKGGHPVLLSRKIIQEICSIKDNDFNLKDVLKNYSGKRVEVDSEKILLNINTPEEYEKHIQSLKE